MPYRLANPLYKPLSQVSNPRPRQPLPIAAQVLYERRSPNEPPLFYHIFAPLSISTPIIFSAYLFATPHATPHTTRILRHSAFSWLGGVTRAFHARAKYTEGVGSDGHRGRTTDSAHGHGIGIGSRRSARGTDGARIYQQPREGESAHPLQRA